MQLAFAAVEHAPHAAALAAYAFRAASHRHRSDRLCAQAPCRAAKIRNFEERKKLAQNMYYY
eukprot:938570-Pleurochrysis_carterae.AAC.4